MDETQRKARGHNFTPPRKVLAKIPALYATEEIPFEDKVIHLHYFSAGTDYYIAELSFEPGEDGQSGRWLGFGYARLANQPEGAEWGLIDITALEAVKARSRQGLPVLVERDKWFEAQAFSAITEVEHWAEEPPAMACPECHEPAV